MRKISDLLARIDGPRNTNTFALFRIAFALFLIAFIAHITYYRPLIFNTIPKLAPNPFPAKLFLSIWFVAALMLLTGFYTRLAAVVNYLFVIIATFSFSNSGSGSFNDDLLRIGSFMLIFIPVNRDLSIDGVVFTVRYGSKPIRQTSYLHYLAVLFVSLGLMYWASSLTKLYSPMWAKGMGLWIPSVMPYNKWHGLSFYLDYKWPMIIINYVTIVWEFLFIFALFTRNLSKWFALVGVLFHIIIGLIFPFPLLCFGPLPFYLLFLAAPPATVSPDKILLEINPASKRQVIFARLALAILPGVRVEHHHHSVMRMNGQLFENNTLAAKQVLKSGFTGKMVLLVMSPEPMRLLALYIADHLNTDQQPPATHGITGYPLKRLMLGVFCVTLLCVQVFYSTYHLYSRAKGGVTTEELKKYYHVRKDITDFSLKPSNLFRTLFGLNARGVFLDHSNMGTKTVFAIIHHGKNGQITWLPFFDQNGYCGNMNMNLAWSKYSFNSVCSGTIPNPVELEKTLWFWVKQHHVNTDSLDLEVVKRTYSFPAAFEQGYHQKLTRQPWIHEGTVSWRKGKFAYHGSDSL